MPSYSKSAGPRASDVRAGDIVICDGTVSHCALVTPKNNLDMHGKIKNVEWNVLHARGFGSTDKWTGIKEDHINTLENGRIFRAKHLSADGIAKVQTAAEALKKASSSYGTSRACFAWAGSTTFGNGAFERLAKYKQRLNSGEHQGVVKNVFCSEFVILCYQLALVDLAQKTSQSSSYFIELDAKHSYPKHLREYLRKNPTLWEEGAFGA